MHEVFVHETIIFVDVVVTHTAEGIHTAPPLPSTHTQLLVL